jgi:hypothetical protein
MVAEAVAAGVDAVRDKLAAAQGTATPDAGELGAPK